MSNETKPNPENRTEQVMNYQAEKITVTPPLSAPLGAPMYSSPWLALYLHLKANFNQNSAS
jgi:hypothetical protein